jgi:hypothetical protein
MPVKVVQKIPKKEQMPGTKKIKIKN